MEKEKNENHFDIIERAMQSLKETVRLSNLSNNDQVALNTLINRLYLYYEKKLAILLHKGIDINSESVMELKSFITEIIVEINSVLTNNNDDIYYSIYNVDKELHDHDRGFSKLISINEK